MELPGIELEDCRGLSVTDQLDPAMVDTLLRLAALIIPRDPMQAFVPSSLEKPCNKICVVVANESHAGAVILRKLDEFLALNKVCLNRGEFFFTDHPITLWQSNHAGGSTTAISFLNGLAVLKSTTFQTSTRLN